MRDRFENPIPRPLYLSEEQTTAYNLSNVAETVSAAMTWTKIFVTTCQSTCACHRLIRHAGR